jgi:endonuclease YncB( thermonuclease family)
LLTKYAHTKVEKYSKKRIRAILVAFGIICMLSLLITCVWLLNGTKNDYSGYIQVSNPQVTDGDSIISDNKIIRLDGINAPKIDQECIVFRCQVSLLCIIKEFVDRIIAQCIV